MTGQEEIIDLVGGPEPTHISISDVEISSLLTGLNFNVENNRNAGQANCNPSSSGYMPQNTNANTLTSQSQFNRNVPLSSTNSHPITHTLPDTKTNHSNANDEFNSNILSHPRQTPQMENFHGSRAQMPQRRDHKIYKWNVKFTGENSKYDAIDFIQKVNALAQSRGVSDQELFDSAIDFFSGQALKWYYTQRSQTNSWVELSEKLISDFIEVNYYDNLLDTIRQRRQQTNESIVNFFTKFEDDCSRLQTLLTTGEKIHIVKKNVLQKYRPYVSLKNYDSLNDLKHDLKLLESSMPSANERNVSFYANKSTHASRYESFRTNRSQSRSPSNEKNLSWRNENPPQNSQNHRAGTPTPNEKARNNSYDRTEKKYRPPSDEKRTESYNRNRSNSRDSNASYRYKPPNHLNK